MLKLRFDRYINDTGLANGIPPNDNNNGLSYINNINVNNNKFSFSFASSSNVFSHLNKLCRSKATTLDNISSKIIRECADLISVSLCDLFTFPDDWKCATVTPLFKQGEASDLNNYRPISLISVTAKVFKRIVYEQLYKFLSNEDIISTRQSGFRSLHLTVTALLETTDNWAFNIDRGNVNNAVVFLYFKKAFDTVDHDILVSKMNLNGIQGIALDWFRSYLTNRTQRCLVNGSLSRICSLKCAVLQGTILGPLFILIYINDLPNCLTCCQPRMYADDTHITYPDVDVNSIQLNLNHGLGNLNKWLTSNKLTLNTTKTEFMLTVVEPT